MIARDLSGGWAEQPVADDQPSGRTLGTPHQLLRLSVRHPAPGVCVVRVSGDLDLLTVPLFDECLREQLGHGLLHLVVDLAVSSLLPLFRCYPTLAHVLVVDGAPADHAPVDRIRVGPSHL